MYTIYSNSTVNTQQSIPIHAHDKCMLMYMYMYMCIRLQTEYVYDCLVSETKGRRHA